jgi:hypothetical protein
MQSKAVFTCMLALQLAKGRKRSQLANAKLGKAMHQHIE